MGSFPPSWGYPKLAGCCLLHGQSPRNFGMMTGETTLSGTSKKSDAQHEQPPKLACDSAIDVSFPKYPQICVDSWLNIRTNKNIAGRPLFQKTYHNFPKHNFPKVICTIFTIELPCITTHFPTVWLSFPKRDNDFFIVWFECGIISECQVGLPEGKPVFFSVQAMRCFLSPRFYGRWKHVALTLRRSNHWRSWVPYGSRWRCLSWENHL